VQTFFYFWKSCFYLVLFGEGASWQVWGKFGQKWCLKCIDLKKCAQHEMKCSRLFLEVIFFRIFFGQVWGNLGKNPSHPQKFACSYTYDAL